MGREKKYVENFLHPTIVPNNVINIFRIIIEIKTEEGAFLLMLMILLRHTILFSGYESFDSSAQLSSKTELPI